MTFHSSSIEVDIRSIQKTWVLFSTSRFEYVRCHMMSVCLQKHVKLETTRNRSALHVICHDHCVSHRVHAEKIILFVFLLGGLVLEKYSITLIIFILGPNIHVFLFIEHSSSFFFHYIFCVEYYFWSILMVKSWSDLASQKFTRCCFHFSWDKPHPVLVGTGHAALGALKLCFVAQRWRRGARAATNSREASWDYLEVERIEPSWRT